MGTLIRGIPAEKQDKRGWAVEVDGRPLKAVGSVRISNPKFGELNYGLTPPGYDGWSFHEIGGGGSVLVPFAVINKVAHVGLVEQARHNQGGKVMNLPRGFLDPGESHFRAAAREYGEEVSADIARSAVIGLPGLPMNPNSAFFETVEPGEGVKCFAVELPAKLLDPQPGGKGRYVLKKDVIQADPASKAAKVAEQVLGSTFVIWADAVMVGDMFTAAAVGRLLGYLQTRG